MPQAQGSRVQLAYIAEATFGTTPPTPQTQSIEFSSFTGTLNADALVDPSINPSRQVSYARRGNTAAEGELTVVLCADNYDAFMEAACMSTYTANVLKIGTTRTSFAIEQGFTDLAQFRVFNGMVVNTMTITVPVDELVTATFGFMGTGTSAFSGTSVDITPTVITVKDKFFHEGGVFKEGGTTVGYLSNIEFTLDNGYQQSYALGATTVREVAAGTLELTGTATALFESVAFYNKFVQNTDSSIEFTLTAGAESLAFLIPKVKYTSAAIPVDGDGPLVVEMGFNAIYDATTTTSFRITRT